MTVGVIFIIKQTINDFLHRHPEATADGSSGLVFSRDSTSQSITHNPKFLILNSQFLINPPNTSYSHSRSSSEFAE